MIVDIKHQTIYNFETNVPRLVQSLKLHPSICKNQKVLHWKISASHGILEESYIDSLGHKVINIYSNNLFGKQIILSEGKIETKDFQGIVKGLNEKVNPLCFLRFTELTKPGEKIFELSKKIKKNIDKIEFYHDLNLIVGDCIKFQSGATDNHTSAEAALQKGKGVCQDYAHILISLARSFNVPARYINGYIVDDHNKNDNFTHAWTELFVEDLGWVAFDPSHKKCIDDNYIRVGCGYDFMDASSIRGVKLNYSGSENLSFKLDISVSQ